jgi:hypothetical protein
LFLPGSEGVGGEREVIGWLREGAGGRGEKWPKHCMYIRMKKKERIITIQHSNPTFGYIMKISKGRDSNICTLIFIAAWFTIAKRWKQPKDPWVIEWINKMWHINTWNIIQP